MNFQDEMAFAGVKVLRDDFKTWRSCTTKRRHSTFASAQTHADRIGGRAYFCENEGCAGFHVTTKPLKNEAKTTENGQK